MPPIAKAQKVTEKRAETSKPTEEWVSAQSKRLSEAASSEGFTFLEAAQSASSSIEVLPNTFLENVPTAEPGESARTRPCRAKAAKRPAETKKQLSADVQKLIG